MGVAFCWLRLVKFYLDILSVYPFIWVCFKCEKCGRPCWLGNRNRSFMNFSYDRGCVICVVWLLVRYVISFGISFWDCLIFCFIVCRLSFLFFAYSC